MLEQAASEPSSNGQSAGTALITGAGGQDGSYLVELLLRKGYHVDVLVRQPESINGRWYRDVYKGVNVHYGTVAYQALLTRLMRDLRPDEVYNLAGQTHIAHSWDMAIETCDSNAMGPLYLFEAIRTCGLASKTRVFQAGTSELFGNSTAARQDETTAFAPTSPYATSKVFAFWTAKNYRDRYDIFAVNGILFNHESPRRSPDFRTYKITQQVAEVKTGRRPHVLIGNPETRRDWGHVADFVNGMWRSLQHSDPNDFVFATGESHSIRDFVELSCRIAGIHLDWRGDGVDEHAIDQATGQVVVRIDPEEFNRESHDTCGNPEKATTLLGWRREKSFEDVVKEMTEAALTRCGK